MCGLCHVSFFVLCFYNLLELCKHCRAGHRRHLPCRGAPAPEGQAGKVGLSTIPEDSGAGSVASQQMDAAGRENQPKEEGPGHTGPPHPLGQPANCSRVLGFRARQSSPRKPLKGHLGLGGNWQSPCCTMNNS